MKTYEFALGSGHVDITLPAASRIQLVEGRPTPPVADVAAAVREALATPIGTPPFKEIFDAGDKVAIVASDLTRGWLRHEQFLPVLLDELNALGIPDKDITLVVALGAHRRHTPAENTAVYGDAVVSRIRIEQSFAEDEADFVHLGTTTRGVPVNISRHVTTADKVIITGGIVYHPMAGFAGGRKAIIPGVSSYATIQANHSYCLAPSVGEGISPTAGCGSLAGNHMHEDQMEIADMVSPAFLLNAILSPDGGFARFVAGHWREAWEAGCSLVADIYGVPIGEKTDLVIASAGGYPKDMNFYQASKATENALAACKEDGVLIAFLECRNIEEPPDFSDWFDIPSLYERELALRQRFTVPGYVALKVGLEARRTPHIIVTMPENKAFFAKVGMTAVTTFAEALALAEEKLGRSGYSVTLLPHAANTAPLLAATQLGRD